MNKSEYYQSLRVLALEMRNKHNVKTPSLNLPKIYQIYKVEGIRIDNWAIRSSKIRAAYFCDNDDYSVMVKKTLPRVPKNFALIHEFKHHLVDRFDIQDGQYTCGAYNANKIVEIGAEVFAAEFIYPESEMLELLDKLKINKVNFCPEKVVEFKRSCEAIISYQFIAKRFVRFGYCEKEELKNIKWQNLEEKLYGRPFYKEQWFQDYRARKKSSSRPKK